MSNNSVNKMTAIIIQTTKQMAAALTKSKEIIKACMKKTVL